VWRAGSAPPLARDRTVAVLGLGVLGAACAQALASLNFRVLGWSRSPKSIDGVETAHGADGLDATLRQAAIVVLLLPDTPATENTLNARTLALLPKGAVIVNPGRGPLIDDDALLAALDSGQVGHATLDVFRTEPLPAEHPYWAHPKVTVTPHIASETRAPPPRASSPRTSGAAKRGSRSSTSSTAPRATDPLHLSSNTLPLAPTASAAADRGSCPVPRARPPAGPAGRARSNISPARTSRGATGRIAPEEADIERARLQPRKAQRLAHQPRQRRLGPGTASMNARRCPCRPPA
jgi:hypothetical protein